MRWHVELQLPRDARQPLFLRLTRAVIEAIRSGRLAPGARLPGTRSLATQLQIHRNTIAAAYTELAHQGWVTARAGSGTRVSELLPLEALAPQRPAEALGFAFQPGPAVVDDARATHGLLKWDFGVPDVRLAPRLALARALRHAALASGAPALEYARYRARDGRLLEQLSAMLAATRGLVVDRARLVLTQGSQQAMYLAARALLRPGDAVAMEDPGYWSARAVFEACGARVVPVPVDDEGLDVDALAQRTRRLRLRAVFVTPHHQFPTTVTLSPRRRVALMSLAAERRCAVLEDDFDHDFHYDGRPHLPLAHGPWGSQVISFGSLSKVFAPGLRVGYAVAPPPVAREMARLRLDVDVEGNHLVEDALAELMELGEFQRHLYRARRVYAARRDHLAALLRHFFDGALEWQPPAGGLAFWVRAPGLDVERWAERALDAGVQVRTGRIFTFDQRPLPALRLGFARLSDAELERACARLKAALPAPRTHRRPIARKLAGRRAPRG